MIGWLINPKSSTFTGGMRPSEDNVLFRLFGKQTLAGASVDESNADQISALFCGITKISDSMKLMPLNKHQRLAAGGSKTVDDESARLFRVKASDEMSPGRLKWLVGAWVLTWGNFYAEIERDGYGKPLALWPIHPSRCRVHRDSSGSTAYLVQSKDGKIDTIRGSNMLHVFRYSKDGLTGTGCVNTLRQTLGTALAADEYAAKFFGNNAMPAHLVTRDEALEPTEMAEFRKNWIEQNGGDKSGGIHFLSGGESTKVHTLTLNNADSQLLETRQFNIQEIARCIPISPMMLYEYGRATWGNFYEVRAMYLGESVMPIAQDFEEECDRKLLTDAERANGHYFKFNTRGVLRVESREQYESFTSALNNGFMCVDEVRELLDMNPLPDGQGQIYMRPSNMTSSAELAAKISRIRAGNGSSADVEFLRDIVKSFLQDKTTNDVIYNLTGVTELMKQVGIPMEPDAVAPWLPVVADAGPLVSGGTVKDDEGDVVGGDVLPSTADPSGNPSNPPEPPPADETKDGQVGLPDSADSGNDASRNDTLVAAFTVTLSDAMERMGTVEANAEKRIGKATDPAIARAEFRKTHIETCRGAFGPTFDGMAKLAGVKDETRVMRYTAHAAEGYVYSGLAAEWLVRGFLQECVYDEPICNASA